MDNRIRVSIQELQEPGAYWKELTNLGGLTDVHLIWPTVGGAYLADIGDAPDQEQVYDDMREQWEKIAAQFVNALHKRSGGSLQLIGFHRPSRLQRLWSTFTTGFDPAPSCYVSPSAATSPEMISSCISHSFGRMMWTAVPEDQAIRRTRSMNPRDVRRMLTDQTWWVAPGHEDPYLLAATTDRQLLLSVVANDLADVPVEFKTEPIGPQALRKFMVY